MVQTWYSWPHRRPAMAAGVDLRAAAWLSSLDVAKQLELIASRPRQDVKTLSGSSRGPASAPSLPACRIRPLCQLALPPCYRAASCLCLYLTVNAVTEVTEVDCTNNTTYLDNCGDGTERALTVGLLQVRYVATWKVRVPCSRAACATSDMSVNQLR